MRRAVLYNLVKQKQVSAANFGLDASAASLQRVVNSLKSTNNPGATIWDIYKRGINQTIIAAPGGVGTTITSGQSPSGFICSKWDSALTPNIGNHWRPRVDAGYAGAPCKSSTDATVIGIGLYIARTAPVIPNFVGIADPTDVSGINNVVPNDFLKRADCGHTIAVWRLERPNSPKWSFHNTGSTNYSEAAHLSSFEATMDPNSGMNAPTTEFGAPSKIVFVDTHMVHTNATDTGANGGNFRRDRVDGSIMEDGTSDSSVDYTATDRDLFLYENGGWNANGAAGNEAAYAIVLASGRYNAMQTAAMRAWGKLQLDWASNLYIDTRDYFLLFGDSEQQPLKTSYTDFNGNNLMPLSHIIRGYRGLPRQNNVTGSVMARSGNTVSKYQFGFTRWAADGDYTDRAHVWLWCWELVNTGPGEIINDTQWLQQIPILFNGLFGNKLNVGTYNTQSNTGNNSTYDVAAARITYVASGLAKYLVDIFNSIVYTAQRWGTNFIQGDPNGPNNEDFTSLHPKSPDTQEIYTPKWAIGNRRMRNISGDDTTGLTWEIVPDSINVTLTSGSPTYTPVWTSKRDDYSANPSQGALTFNSRNASVCTVDAVTGQITAVGVGQTAVDCWDAVGGKGNILVIVTSVPVIPPDTTTGLRVALRFDNDLTDHANGNNFSGVNGSPTFQAGLINQEMVIAGTVYISKADQTDLRLFRVGQHGMLVCGFVNPVSLSGVKCYASKVNEWGLFAVAGNGDAVAQVRDGSGTVIGTASFPNGTITAGVRNFIAMRVDLDLMLVFLTVNGATTSASITGTPNVGTTNPVTIGSFNGSFTVPGAYDAWEIYDTKHVTGDVSALYNAGAGLQP